MAFYVYKVYKTISNVVIYWKYHDYKKVIKDIVLYKIVNYNYSPTSHHYKKIIYFKFYIGIFFHTSLLR